MLLSGLLSLGFYIAYDFWPLEQAPIPEPIDDVFDPVGVGFDLTLTYG